MGLPPGPAVALGRPGARLAARSPVGRAGAPADPWERHPLATGAGEEHSAILATLQSRLTLLLKTERRNWP